MYERILVPTDGSPYSENAAEKGFELAETTGADVYVVSVVEVGPLGSIRLPGDSASAEEVFTEQAREAVSRIAERATDRGIDAVTEIREGTTVQEILSYAEEIDADLVVMGTRGRGGVDKMVLGSVTTDVTQYGDIDVLVVDDSDVEA